MRERGRGGRQSLQCQETEDTIVLCLLKGGFLSFTELLEETGLSRPTLTQGLHRLEAKSRIKKFPEWALEGTTITGKRSLRRGKTSYFYKHTTPKGGRFRSIPFDDDTVLFNYIWICINREHPHLAHELEYFRERNNLRPKIWWSRRTKRRISKVAESYFKMTMGDFSSKREYYGLSFGFKPVGQASTK